MKGGGPDVLRKENPCRKKKKKKGYSWKRRSPDQYWFSLVRWVLDVHQVHVTVLIPTDSIDLSSRKGRHNE